MLLTNSTLYKNGAYRSWNNASRITVFYFSRLRHFVLYWINQLSTFMLFSKEKRANNKSLLFASSLEMTRINQSHCVQVSTSSKMIWLSIFLLTIKLSKFLFSIRIDAFFSVCSLIYEIYYHSPRCCDVNDIDHMWLHCRSIVIYLDWTLIAN